MWGQKQGFKVSEIDYQAGDGAGIKSATLQIDGDFAYGLLKSENRRASTGAYFRHSIAMPAAYFLCISLCLSGSR
jgi:hypothetical protein